MLMFISISFLFSQPPGKNVLNYFNHLAKNKNYDKNKN